MPADANRLFRFLFPEEAVHSTRLFEAGALQEWQTPEKGPYFDTTVPSNVTGLVGKTIQLVCKVKNLGNRTVSIVVIGCLQLREIRGKYLSLAGWDLHNTLAFQRN